MTPEVIHTLPNDILMAYSTGQLPEVFDLVVATHVSLSDESRARLGGFDAIGGAVLEQTDAVEMSSDSLAATLAMISGPAKPPIHDTVNDRTNLGTPPVFPKPLRDFAGGDLDRIHWKNIGMGCKQAILFEDGKASVRLLSIPPGSQMPDHGHGGTEMTLVLQGAFRDGDSVFNRGDVELADENVDHAPEVVGDETCICLAATDKRLRFKSLIPRLAQPFFRI